MTPTVRLGFEVGSGLPVEIPLAHTFVTGQTQLSGKTTTLRAIVDRSGQRALAFVTKRGEDLPGRRIRPYLPREGEKQIPWRLVETIMAAAVGQRNMKWERGAIVTASKGATSLLDVRRNVERLREKTKGDRGELYMLLGEYLDLVLPEMAALRATPTLELDAGLNVMDLTGVGLQTQAMVIRAALEHINHAETHVLTVLPEAWEFAPRARQAAAKDEAIAMARKGGAPKVRNFLLVDSQDIAGVEPVIRQACSVWLIGVQRELNEVKRAIEMMKQAGIAHPKSTAVAQLELGQFYACWGRHAVKTYVQPDWMEPAVAASVARGEWSAAEAARTSQQIASVGTVRQAFQALQDDPPLDSRALGDLELVFKEDTVNAAEAQALRDQNLQLQTEVNHLRDRLAALEGPHRPVDLGRSGAARGTGTEAARQDPPPLSTGDRPAAPRREPPRTSHPDFSGETENLYQAFKARFLSEVHMNGSVVLQVTAPHKLRADFQQAEVDRLVQKAQDLPLLARQTMKLLEGLGKKLMQVTILARLGRSPHSRKEIGQAVALLKELGFVTADTNGVGSSLRSKIEEDLAAYAPSDDDVEACYQQVLYALAEEDGR